jgi:hypothetical protein
LEQRHTEISEEEGHILSLSVHYLSGDNFWCCDRTVEKTVVTERLSLAYCGCLQLSLGVLAAPSISYFLSTRAPLASQGSVRATTQVERDEPSHGLDYLLVDFKSLLRKAPDKGVRRN